MTSRNKRNVVAVHVCADEVEADVIMSLLRSHGIDSFTNISAAIPVAAGPMGEVSIYVDEGHAEKAIEVLRESKSKAG